MSNRNHWFILILLSTVLTGLVLRWQLAGTSLEGLTDLDWRRAHSHLGFYGVLFPLSWICLQITKAWIPSARLSGLYNLLVVGAGLAFLFQGYGLFSIAASTGILIVWLIFAWKNWRFRKLFSRNWETTISVSVFLSALLIFAVAFLTRSQPAIAQQLARAFLTILLFGVFIPSVLRLFGSRPSNSFFWIAAMIASALYLTKISNIPFLGYGAVALGLTILKNVLSSPNQDLRLKISWAVFSIGLGLSGLNLVPYSYHQAIAGIHFLVLGPILMSFALIRLQLKMRKPFRIFYELSLASMVFGIALQEFVSLPLHALIAWSATGLVACLILIVADSSFFSTRNAKIKTSSPT